MTGRRADLEAAIGAVPGVVAVEAAEISDGAPWRTALVVHVDLDPAVADAPGAAARGALGALAAAGADMPSATVTFTTHRPREERLDGRAVAAAADVAHAVSASRRSIVVDARGVQGLVP